MARAGPSKGSKLHIHMRHAEELMRLVAEGGWQAVRREPSLSMWVATMRHRYRRGVLESSIIAALEAIPGWTLKPKEVGVRQRLGELKAHVAERGWDLDVAYDAESAPLRTWVRSCRKRLGEGRLPLDTAAELEQVVGWCWQAREGRRRFLAALKAAWSEANGPALVVGGHDVSAWVDRCHADWNAGRKMPQRLKVELRQIFGWKR